MIVLNNNSCKKRHHKLSRLKININCIFVKFFEKFKNKYFLFLFETSAYNCVQMVNLRTICVQIERREWGVLLGGCLTVKN